MKIAMSLAGDAQGMQVDKALSEETALLPSTFRWLAMLPKGVRPMTLGQQFPRIANKLAILWEEPAVCRKFLTSFMLDDRGDRDGFPPEVIMELSTLEAYIDTGAVPARPTLGAISD
jgi:hypothetical protein